MNEGILTNCINWVKNTKTFSKHELEELTYLYNLLKHKDLESGKNIPRRSTIVAESNKFEENDSTAFLPLKEQYEIDTENKIDQYVFMPLLNSEIIKQMKNSLSYTKRYDHDVILLEKAVYFSVFFPPETCSSLMNVLLQTAESKSGDANSMDSLIDIWGGQKLSFRITKNDEMQAITTAEEPSEIAFYKLEKKHSVYKRFAEEFSSLLNKMYSLNNSKKQCVYSVGLSMRFLVPNRGGNPVHVDAWKDTVKQKNALYINQQFSFFLSADEREEFIVFDENDRQTLQTENGSLLGFNPTQKHHHPDGHGSWIMIIEVLFKVSLD